MQYNSIESIFKGFEKLKVLIIGDVMIDAYLWGKVERISPEAPVPIVQVERKEKRLGGAANVAINIQALGAIPILCTLIGNDQDGVDFLKILDEHQLSKEGIVKSEKRITTVKNRILAGHQHVLRVDSEVTTPPSKKEREALFEAVKNLIRQCDVIIFEDYDKGVLDKKLIQQVIQLAQKHKIPTIVDPKKRNFLAYESATLFKPNLKELKEGLKLDFDSNQTDELKNAIQLLKQRMNLENVFVTLSEKGVYLDTAKEQILIPAHVRSIADVSGAGDTVVSVASLCMALGLPSKLVAELSNLAGGLVCEYIGVVPINKQELMAEAVNQKILV